MSDGSPTVHVYLQSTAQGTVQIVGGLALLRRQGRVEVALRRWTPRSGLPNIHAWGLWAELDGVLIAFDLRDSPEVHLPAVERCDVYVKRSFDAEINAATGRPEVFVPFGLNYDAAAPGDWSPRRMYWSLRCHRELGWRQATVRATRESAILSLLARDRFSRASYTAYESLPQPSPNPRVFCFTRIWDPEQVSHNPGLAADWRAINELRVACIRRLRADLGPRFTGGLAASPYACEHFADVVVDPSPVRSRWRYLRASKEHDIGVVFAGLRRSTGFRLGEFVAASRAIAAEPLAYPVPGDFAADVHYAPFRDPSSCVEQVVALIEDDEHRERMMRENWRYYNEYVRPDRIVWHALEAAQRVAGSA